jgi:RhoGEF, Guanine nucleotide exchange factor for Rho/Rac/Cdc42-like GTPases
MNFIIYFSKMANDLSQDIKENIDNNKDVIKKEDYEDTLDVFDHLTEVLQNIDQYGQNTTRTLKAMEEVLKERTGGYVDMDLLPVLQQSEEMLGQDFAKEIAQYHIQTVFSLPTPVVGNLPSIPIHGNPDMLSKTIINLLGNAVYAVVRKAKKISYTPEVSLTATVTDGHCILKDRKSVV